MIFIFLLTLIKLSGHYVPTSGDSTLGSNLSELLDRTHLGTGSDVNNGATPPMAKPVSNWSRSYQNPIGTMYYPPSESEGAAMWAWPPNSNPNQESPQGSSPQTSTPPMPVYSNYYDLFRQERQAPMFYDPRPQALGNYLPNKPTKAPPMALGTFLPMGYRGVPSSHGSQNFDISPKSRRSGKSQRPYSADVNQLFSVEEDSRSNNNATFKKGK